MSDRTSVNFGSFRPALGTLLSVPLTVIAFPPVELHHLIWFALVPWLYSLSKCSSIIQALIQGCWFHLLFGMGSTFWLAHAVPQYLDLPSAFGFVTWFLHGTVSQLQFAVFAPLFYWQVERSRGPLGGAGLLLSALLYSGIDWAIPNVFQDTMGLPLHAYAAISQTVELGGISVLTFIVLTVNLGVLSLIQIALDSRTANSAKMTFTLSTIMVVALVVAGSWSFGAKRYREITALIQEPIRTVRVGVIQGNVPNDVRRRWALGDPEAARDTLERYVEATDQLLRDGVRPALIVWPETAYPGIFRKPENQQQLLLNVTFDRYIASIGLPFLFGAYDRDERSDLRVLRNALFFVQPQPNQATDQLSPVEVYHKYILFPVGESLPFFGAESIREWVPNAGGFSKGAGPRLYEIIQPGQKPIRFGPSVCYEDVFSSHTAAVAELGAELLINVSNDSWFGDYGEPRLHLIFAKLASIQSRLPHVRATNTGYSALILPNGDMPHLSAYGKAQTFDMEVSIIEPQTTLATRWKSWFGATSLFLSLSGLALIRALEKGGIGA